MRFEERVLMDLKAEIERRAARRRRNRRLYASGAVAAVAAAVAVAVPSLTVAPAYAVSTNADGTVRVEINEFKDADKLERDLMANNVRADITYLPPGKQCKSGRGKTFGGRRAMGPDADAVARRVRGGGFDIDPRLLANDQTLVLEFAGHTENIDGLAKDEPLYRLTASIIVGPVAPCVPIDDPTYYRRVHVDNPTDFPTP
ncbi:hypothetical protein ACFMQL_11445 [Nonomuraea fastidiosa]|uniref:hypothetical protein n=1 Tax=Nonomuraea fastidiosa TaxID=46173 RepID=UPI00366DF7E4